MNNNQSPPLNGGGSPHLNIVPSMLDLKAQNDTRRMAELLDSAELARQKAGEALKAELAASEQFIRAVVELSGTAPYLPQEFSNPRDAR